MLKYLFWMIGVFAVAVGCVYLFAHLDGRVSLLLNATSYEVSLRWVFLMLILLIALLYIVYLLISFLYCMSTRLFRVNKERKKNNVIVDLNSILISFFEGRYNRTIQLVDNLLKNKYLQDLKVSALIFGAESADKINNFQKRDNYLNQLQENDLPNELLPNLIRAKGALKEQDYAKYIEYSDKVKWYNPKLTALVESQLTYALKTKDSDILLEAIKQLRKNNAISESDYRQYELNAYQFKLAVLQTSDDLDKFCKNIASNIKENIQVIDLIAQKYYELQNYQTAVDWSLKQYPKTKSNQLLNQIFYSFNHVSNKSQNRIIITLENWLKNDRENSDLLLLLGNLAYQNQLWGKARIYLEVSTSTHPTILGWVMLSKLYAKEGAIEKANEANEKALELVAQFQQ